MKAPPSKRTFPPWTGPPPGALPGLKAPCCSEAPASPIPIPPGSHIPEAPPAAPDLCGSGPKTHCFPGYRTGGSPKSLAYAGGIPLGKVSGAEPLLPVQQLPPPVLPHKIRILHPFVPMGSVLRSLYPQSAGLYPPLQLPKRKRFPGQRIPHTGDICIPFPSYTNLQDPF